MARENLPQAHFTFLTSKAFSPILKGFPSLDKVLTIDKDIYRRKNVKEFFLITKELLITLRSDKYQLVVDFQSFGDTALLSWLSGANMRWGITHKKLRDRFYTMGLEESPHPKPHQIDINRKLLEKGSFKTYSLNNKYNLPEENIQAAAAFFTESGYTPAKVTFFIQPFTHYTEKNWSIENYLNLAKHWRNQGIQIIFGGGPSDRENLKQIAAEFPVSAGKVSLLTAAGLMQLSNLVIGNDTGLLHLAVAMEKRVLMLMASTSPAEYGPYGHPDWTVTPVNSYKIEDIKVGDVNEAITKIHAEL